MPKRMISPQARARRKEKVKAKAAAIDVRARRCIVWECRNPVRAGTDNGLDQRFCRKHAEQKSRHGSAYASSYTAAQVNPYRRAAAEWLIANGDDRWASNAVERVRSLYHRGGQYIEAFSLRGLPPRDRANAAWARLRKFEVDPRLVVAAALAIEMIQAEGRHPVSNSEYKRVQIAKLVHKLASGSHKHYPTNKAIPEVHKYPPSRGRVLRLIGADAEAAVELLVDQRMGDILTFKADRAGTGKQPARAKPRTVTGRKQTPVAAAKRAARKPPKTRPSFAKPGTYKVGNGITVVTK